MQELENGFSVDEYGNSVSSGNNSAWANAGNPENSTIDNLGSCNAFTLSKTCKLWTTNNVFNCSSNCEGQCGSGGGYIIRTDMTSTFMPGIPPQADDCGVKNRLMCVEQ